MILQKFNNYNIYTQEFAHEREQKKIKEVINPFVKKKSIYIVIYIHLLSLCHQILP